MIVSPCHTSTSSTLPTYWGQRRRTGGHPRWTPAGALSRGPRGLGVLAAETATSWLGWNNSQMWYFQCFFLELCDGQLRFRRFNLNHELSNLEAKETDIFKVWIAFRHLFGNISLLKNLLEHGRHNVARMIQGFWVFCSYKSLAIAFTAQPCNL